MFHKSKLTSSATQKFLFVCTINTMQMISVTDFFGGV